MRWCVHVLGRLAIAATCTNSAAAPEAHVDRGEYLSSAYSMWEHIMSNSAESANRMATRYNGQGRELRLEAREKTCAAREYPAQRLRLDSLEMSPQPSAMPVMKRLDRGDTSSGPSVLAFFIEAFALCGASYCNLLHAIATSPVESLSIESESENLSVPERRRSIAIVASSMSPKSMRLEFDETINRAGVGSEVTSEDAGLAQSCSLRSFTDGPNLRHWLSSPCSTVASRWTQWRREREIKKAVAALLALDDRTLRDIGIPHRSEIEQVVRYCFDC
jgi:uncharacterized protein YjiS (DUF1127 family)